jgi:hypothetical protein
MKLNEWIQTLQIKEIKRSNNDGIMETTTPEDNEICSAMK